MIFHTHVAAVAFLSAVGALAAAEPPSEIRAPHSDYSIRVLEKRLPGADSVFGVRSIALYRGPKLLSQSPTTGWLIDAYWSPDGHFVAVNNRRGHEGDYLWVFSLRSGRPLKQPDDKVGDPKGFVRRINKRFPACTDDSLYRYYITGLGWRASNELKVRTDVRFHHTDPGMVLIDDLYKVTDHGFTRIEESLRPATPDA